jgi:hypothetical protein
MNDLTQTIQDLPLAGLIPVALVVIVGMILWGAGRRVLRVAFATLGLIGGTGAGWLLLGSHDLGVSPWLPSLVLGVALACLGALVYRMALAAALALVCAVAAPAGVLTVGELQGDHQAAPVGMAVEVAAEPDTPRTYDTREGPVVDEASVWLFDRLGEGEGAIPGSLAERGLDQMLPEKVAEARAEADRLVGVSQSWWEGTPEGLRPAIVGAAITGALAGLLAGTLLPAATAVVVSAFGGSLIWLSGLRVLMLRLEQPVEAWLPDSTAGFLVLWLIISLLGTAIQWTTRPKAADKQRAEKAPARS